MATATGIAGHYREDGGGGACDVLFLVPEVLFLAYMVFTASKLILGLIVAPLGDRRPPYSHPADQHDGGGGAGLRGTAAVVFTAAGAMMLAAMVIPTLAQSLKVVLRAPVAVVMVAAAAAVAMMVLALVASVALVVTLVGSRAGFGGVADNRLRNLKHNPCK